MSSSVPKDRCEWQRSSLGPASKAATSKLPSRRKSPIFVLDCSLSTIRTQRHQLRQTIIITQLSNPRVLLSWAHLPRRRHAHRLLCALHRQQQVQLQQTGRKTAGTREEPQLQSASHFSHQGTLPGRGRQPHQLQGAGNVAREVRNSDNRPPRVHCKRTA